jgi:methylated-DNA-[protein]-cysteine S-methyltransferase
MSQQPAYERFARAEAALEQGQRSELFDSPAFSADLDLAEGLRRSAAASMPDPAFVSGLREHLRLEAHSTAQKTAEDLRYSTVHTPLGLLAIAYRNERVVYCSMLDRADEAAFERAVAQQFGVLPLREAAAPAALEHEIQDHMAGRRRFRAVDLSALTPFQQRVLTKTAEIPRGEVRPYGWVAREIGSPGATRAVGTALGHNPIPFLIPCHRVVRSDGSLGEYSGGGPMMKRRVLAFEGARLEAIS